MRLIDAYHKAIDKVASDQFTNDYKATHIKLGNKLILDMHKATREKDKEKINALIKVSYLIDMDQRNEKFTMRFNKAIDNCNDVLKYY